MCSNLRISIEVPVSSLPLPLRFCHCDTCRSTTGELAHTVLPVANIEQKSVSIIGTSVVYSAGPNLRHFCGVCGTHVYETIQGNSKITVVVAGAVITGGSEIMEFSGHIYVGDTLDGGMSPWVRGRPIWQLQEGGGYYHRPAIESYPVKRQEENLFCSCRCGGVKFSISPPNASSVDFSAEYPELFAAVRTSPQNLQDEKYWLNQDRSRYIATICPCTDCRRASGSELPSWAFIPKVNIRAVDGSPFAFGTDGDAPELKTYASSSGIKRDFCGRCGAKVFFRMEQKPEIIDVGPGIIHSKTGARAEGWLVWCTSRISFSTEAGTRNQKLVDLIQNGRREWAAETGRESLP